MPPICSILKAGTLPRSLQILCKQEAPLWIVFQVPGCRVATVTQDAPHLASNMIMVRTPLAIVAPGRR